MKKTLVLLFCGVQFLFAQISTRRDSLIFELSLQPQDTTRLEILQSLMDEVSLTDPKLGLEYSLEMTELSEKANYKLGIAKGYDGQAYFYGVLGDFDKSLDLYMKLIPVYVELDSMDLLASTYSAIGYHYMKIGKPDLCLYYSFKGLDLNILVHDTVATTNSLIIIGGMYTRLDKFQKAMNYLRAALALSLAANDLSQIGHCLRNIGKVFKEQKDYDEAFYCYSQAYIISSRDNNKEKMARELNGMGNIMEGRGNFRIALRYYEAAIKVLEGFGFKRELGNTLTNIGYWYYQNGELEKASAFYEQALDNYRPIYEKEGTAQVTFYLGQLYFKNGNLDKAEEFAKESYQLAEEMGYPSKVMNSASLLSQIYKSRGKMGEYIKTFERYVIVKDSVDHNNDRKLINEQKVQFDEYKIKFAIDQELKNRIQKENDQIARRNLLQYSLMTLAFLLSFGFILSLGYIKLSPRVAQAFIFVTLLTLFEFILVLTDPIMDRFTNGIPLYKVLINSLLALSIFPIQTFMEKGLKRRIDKSKKN